MNAQSGFTLIEALSTGIISTIVAGALLSVLHMSNTQIREGSETLRNNRIQIVVSDQIRKSTRSAKGVKTTGEDPTLKFEAPLNLLPFGLTPVKEIQLCDLNGAPFAGYLIRPRTPVAYLEEWKEDGASGPGYYAFTIGDDTAFIDEAASFFGILPNREGVDFTIRYARVVDGKSYTFPLIRETAMCRNR